MSKPSLRQKLPHLRLTIQLAFLSYTLWMGWKFYHFFLWTKDAGPYAARHPAVEGFLPIGALLSSKRLFLSGEFDPLHPAGLTIFLAALCLGLLARKGFCGWICPVGAVSNLAEQLSNKLKILFTLPGWINTPLLGLKYFALAFFGYAIILFMPLDAVKNFMGSPYYVTADGRMLLFFLEPSRLALIITLTIIFLSFIVRNFWCRYLCPYGALLGLLALIGPFALKRDKESCTNCQKCSQSCPAEIVVHTKDSLRSPECIGCLECTAACPVEGCLRLTACNKTTPLWLLPVIILALYFAFYIWAELTGHWHGRLDADSLKNIFMAILHRS